MLLIQNLEDFDGVGLRENQKRRRMSCGFDCLERFDVLFSKRELSVTSDFSGLNGSFFLPKKG